MIKKQRRPLEEINSSSMADIAFLLLVFFLVTTTISMDKGISLVLPSEGNELEVNRKNIVNILMNESGKVLIDDKPTKVNAIRGIVERKLSGNPNLIFSVQTHPRTKYQNYLQILDQLKEAKATKISIANPPAF
ncbi:MAG TPA: biopolymer transporter ExbD [Candidatus Marinimicrobia bacterium]|jgi:biopolymer transport protein ExbD|nr:MAG: biopolymer transporter ExbD [Candidatus Neomarinimicrobiota bacterium]HIM53339.1 biopolymer transporter ExbD [Candidatus Neomarinimicrobiota bacterium]HIO40305.1 biopolymer transporter ExbD [Candidatus Neomarinimicrobiota bacterium]|tara:strand:- start:438 stop:839 length:402 start_codon:yes stop_codon:yes gene_type:complete